ncbi:MAG: glutathione S-transferase family protein [Alphaproteobacteria bacterium]|nr:glutathione S-transferase family protein [Alphaproteobacteria bacterium]
MAGRNADITLWGIGSSRALRAHWALIELGLDYETVPIRNRTPAMESPEYLAINPRKKIPTLRDGDLILTESAAIVTYLAETYSIAERRLIPEDPRDRAVYFEWMSFVSMELDATALYVLRRHEGLPEIYGEAPTANDAARAYFDRMIGAAVVRLEDGRRFLLGDDFSGADILMTTCLDWARRYRLDVPDPFLAYRERAATRPSYAAAIEANTPP